ncbi:MAG: hypothetical protein EBU66_14190 [Bacteroidetes bacterium]|nr:hypothetical protein [bacterium]NBP65799.1 hypothetical protein [Bacteroidota bacterium]
MKSKITVFNLETNLDSPLLATSHSWLQEISKHFDEVKVISTHVGRYELPSHVKVHELGGGTLLKRLRAIWRLSTIFFQIAKDRSDQLVLHHMSPRTATFPGVFLRMLGIPQVLWYSHSSYPVSLKFGVRFVNLVLSSTPSSIPYDGKKLECIGHGIDFPKKFTLSNSIIDSGIIAIGRISPIKNLDVLIQLIGDSAQSDLPVTLIGPSNADYRQRLEELAAYLDVNLLIYEAVPHKSVFKKLSSHLLYYSGMQNSVDKSALEASSMGCLVVTTDASTLDLTGMSKFWMSTLGRVPTTLEEQVSLLTSLDSSQLTEARNSVAHHTRENNNISMLVDKILTLTERL